MLLNRDHPLELATIFILVFSSIVILMALAFQHIGGHIPCTLCYYERYAYYFAISATVVILMLGQSGQISLARILLLIVMLAFLANTVLGIYHAGAEWKFWDGPTFCGNTSSIANNADSLLDSLGKMKIVKCDEASGRFMGLSFAGYNVLASLFLAYVACLGSRMAGR